MQPLVPGKSVGNNSSTVENTTGFVPFSIASTTQHQQEKLQQQDGDSAKIHQNIKVETVDVDGVVQKIRVFCCCGEIIEIDCGYPD
jgi:hypothetical protein